MPVRYAPDDIASRISLRRVYPRIVAGIRSRSIRSTVDPSDATVIVALACIVAAGLLYSVYAVLVGL